MTFNRSGEAELRLLVSPRAFSIMRIQAIDSLNICAAVRWPAAAVASRFCWCG